MFCRNCGKQIADGTKFCNFCGKPTTNQELEVVEEAEFTETNIVPFVNEVEMIKNDEDDFNDEHTELIFDRKLPKDRLNAGGSKGKVIALVSVFVVLLIGAAVAIFMVNKYAGEKIKNMQITGRETSENGKIVYNKGNNKYAKNEIIKEGKDSYYFDNDGYLFKGDWVEVNGKWYYCESDGKIAKNKWIEQLYYVDDDGEMMKNAQTPDGYLVGADGKWVEQTTAAPTTTASHNNYNPNPNPTTYYYQPTPIITPTIAPTEAAPIGDTTKEIYIQKYETYTSYLEHTDTETNVDISIKYPIFGGQDASEIANINNCIQNSMSELESYIEGDINEEDKAPKNVKITEATINLEGRKVYVVLKGTMARSGKASRNVRYRFVYERDSQTSYVRD